MSELIKSGKESIKFWQDKNDHEVDIVLDKTIIEIKFKTSFKQEDLIGLKAYIKQYKNVKKAYLINIKKFDEGRKKGIHSIKLSRRKHTKYLFSDFELTPEICEFVGAFIGDGFFNCYKNKLYHIEFAGDSRYDLDYYKKVIIPSIKSIVPNIKPHIYKVKSRNSIRIIFYSF